MIQSRDLYTYQIKATLAPTGAADSAGKPFGTTIITYEIRRYENLKNLKKTFAYHIICTQRIVIPNPAPYQPGPNDINLYANYPALFSNQIEFKNPPSGQSLHILTYSPRTINAAISMTSSEGDQSSQSTSRQHTTGSATSQTNSYGASASLGFIGDSPTGSLSGNYEHSTTTEHSQSTGRGSESGSQHDVSGSDAFTVKDWAAYAYTDASDSIMTWVWGQEFPWNVIQYRYTTSKDGPITLPQFANDRLYDQQTKQVLPPSQLSQFGVDFTMKAAWVVEPLPTATTIQLSHTIDYFTASHSMPANDTSANAVPTATPSLNCTLNSIGKAAVDSPVLDLCLAGLDPITATGPTQAAIIGFVPNQFLVGPVPGAAGTAPTKFKIISANNNLMIDDATEYKPFTAADAGAGFAASETALIARFSENCPTLTMLAAFKVIDTTSNYSLNLKSWVTGSAGALITIVINGNTANPLVKLVDAREAEGGERNLLTISLRDLDFGSVDFHNYLLPGLNTLSITLAPENDDYKNCVYQLRAISVESD